MVTTITQANNGFILVSGPEGHETISIHHTMEELFSEIVYSFSNRTMVVIIKDNDDDSDNSS